MQIPQPAGTALEKRGNIFIRKKREEETAETLTKIVHDCVFTLLIPNVTLGGQH